MHLSKDSTPEPTSNVFWLFRSLSLTKGQPSIILYYSELDLSPHDAKLVTIQCLLISI